MNKEMNVYRLIAMNKQDSSVTFKGDSIEEVLRKFDAEYTRSGFKIEIYMFNDLVKTIKKTFA